MDGIDVDLDLSRLSLWSKEAKIFAVKMQVGHEELKSIGRMTEQRHRAKISAGCVLYHDEMA